jgi:glycosyltransferase involved in cell wall biosynthesis
VRVSVVVPLYNKAPFVGACIKNVLAQTMGDFELIVVDDGSTDEGVAIAESTGDERVRVVSYPNGGVSAARNRGLALARSELVAFLDADDLWEPRFLEATTGALDRHPEAAAVFCAFGEGKAGRSRLPALEYELVIEDYPKWFIRTRGRGLWCSNSLARKEALVAAGLFPEGVQSGEDTDTWFRLSFEGPVVYLPELLSRYVVDDQSSLSKGHGAREPIVIGSIQAALGRGAVPAAARVSAAAAIDYFHVAYAAALAMEGRRGEALAEARKARLRFRLWRSYARAVAAFVLGR